MFSSTAEASVFPDAAVSFTSFPGPLTSAGSFLSSTSSFHPDLVGFSGTPADSDPWFLADDLRSDSSVSTDASAAAPCQEAC